MDEAQTERRNIALIGWFVLWGVIGSASFYGGTHWIDQVCQCIKNEVTLMFTCPAIPVAGLSAAVTGSVLYAVLRKVTQWRGLRLVITVGLAILAGVAGYFFFAAIGSCDRCRPDELPAGCPPDCQGLTRSNAWLRDVDLSNADLSNAALSSADLRGANLQGADLTGANLYDADLWDANLQGADLTDVNLYDAWLWNANLQGAKMPGVVLAGASLHSAQLQGAQMVNANLSEAALNGANLSQADLTGADLSEANLHGAELTGANLTAADLTGAYLRGADLSSADLRRAILSEAQYNDKTIWPDGFGPVEAGAILIESN